MMAHLNLYPACGLNGYEGYGRVEIGLVKGLQQAGIAYQLWPDPAHPTLLTGNPKWAAAPLMEGQRVWCYTMIESTRASLQWVTHLNTHCERVLLPVEAMVPYMRDSGVNIPIHVVTPGVDAFDMPYRERQRETPFTFLTYSYGDIRKGAELVVMAFRMLFEGDERFRLVVKARDGGHIQWLKTVESDQIHIVRGKISESELRALYDSAHCFVFPSRAEGFGLPPREAVLSGLPAIATEWLGMADVACWGYPLPVQAMTSVQYEIVVNNHSDALWAEPSFEALLHQMEAISRDYERAIARQGAQREYLMTHFTWSHTAQQIAALLEAYA